MKMGPVTPGENILRFLVDSDQFNARKNYVKPGAFTPPSDGQFSIYRVDGISVSEQFGIGREYVDALRSDGKTVKAGARLKASAYTNEKLDFKPDGTPHDRHACVFGWPSAREDLVAIKVELAIQAVLVLPA